VCTYIGKGGGLNSIEHSYLQTTSYLRLNDKVGDRTKQDKIQRMIGLLCAALEAMNCSFQTFYLLIKLPYYVL